MACPFQPICMERPVINETLISKLPFYIVMMIRQRLRRESVIVFWWFLSEILQITSGVDCHILIRSCVNGIIM